MTLTQEELNQKFPKDPLPNTQFSVAWYVKNLREVVVVYDKLSHRVVYVGSSKSRKDHYAHIQKFYGKENCDPPKEVNPQFYEGI
jgi:hypothetical protein